MNRAFFFLTSLVIAFNVLGQAPHSFNYQAILRNADGTIKENETISLQIRIVDDQGNASYLEIHNATTNEFGLVNLVIGEGTTSDDLSTIDWTNGPYFLEITLNGTTLGTSQLLSVPYAIYAQRAGEVKNGDNWGTPTVVTGQSLDGTGTVSDPLEIAQQGASSGQVLKWNGSSWTAQTDEKGVSYWFKDGEDIYYDAGVVRIKGNFNNHYEPMRVYGRAIIKDNVSGLSLGPKNETY